MTLSTATGSPAPRQDAADVAFGIRCRVLEHTIANNGGYLSQACSAAELVATLYTGLMELGSGHA